MPIETDQLSKIVALTSIEDVWKLHCENMAEYGFDRLIYGFTKFAHGSSLGDIKDAVILTRHDPEYVSIFIDEGMYEKGPMIRWAANNVGAGSWNMIQDMAMAGELSEDEMEMLSINMKMGVTAGYTISFNQGTSRTRGALGMTAKRGLSQDEVDEIWKEHGEDIQLSSNIMHMKISSLPHMNMRRSLTRRQAEVLEWVADGKTIRDIAEIMGLNAATVEKHLRLARLALDVDTTAAAIHKVGVTRQIFVVESSAPEAPVH